MIKYRLQASKADKGRMTFFMVAENFANVLLQRSFFPLKKGCFFFTQLHRKKKRFN